MKNKNQLHKQRDIDCSSHSSKPDAWSMIERAMSAINYFLCPFLSPGIDRRRYASLEETILDGTAYVSNKIFNASNFLMAFSGEPPPSSLTPS